MTHVTLALLVGLATPFAAHGASKVHVDIPRNAPPKLKAAGKAAGAFFRSASKRWHETTITVRAAEHSAHSSRGMERDPRLTAGLVQLYVRQVRTIPTPDASAPKGEAARLRKADRAFRRFDRELVTYHVDRHGHAEHIRTESLSEPEPTLWRERLRGNEILASLVDFTSIPKLVGLLASGGAAVASKRAGLVTLVGTLLSEVAHSRTAGEEARLDAVKSTAEYILSEHAGVGRDGLTWKEVEAHYEGQVRPGVEAMVKGMWRDLHTMLGGGEIRRGRKAWKIGALPLAELAPAAAPAQ